jgi:murein DD-endopeptidase MepM/ murein hydrolase activator NlpD
MARQLRRVKSWRSSGHRFATRRLKVDDSFANPSASVADRITQEAQVLTDLFAKTRSGRLWRGSFVLPVPGEATSSYGRITTLNGKQRGQHQGADFRAAVGTPVRAPNAGEVVLAADHYFPGNTIVLDHGDGLYSLFAHLSRVAVHVGTRVARGDILGETGATGRVTGPHLHWAVRLQGTSVDPLSLVAAVAEIDETLK